MEFQPLDGNRSKSESVHGPTMPKNVKNYVWMCRFPATCKKVNACNYQNHPAVLVTCSSFNMFQVNPYTRGHCSPFPTQTCAQKRNFATSKRIGNKHWSNIRHDNATSDTHACHTQNTTLPQKKKLPPRTGHNTAESERNTCHAQDTTLPCQDKIFWGKKTHTQNKNTANKSKPSTKKKKDTMFRKQTQTSEKQSVALKKLR